MMRQEHADFVEKHGKIALADGVIDAALPVVELHLRDGGRSYDERDKNKIPSNAMV